MFSKLMASRKVAAQKRNPDLAQMDGAVHAFHSDHYLRHNARRLEHLASLGIPCRGKSVLEVGAGIGDHSHFYLDRKCHVTITEARPENLRLLRNRYPLGDIQALDMEQPVPVAGAPFDIVHCYGLLYHLSNPQQALAFLSQNVMQVLLLETCVSFGEQAAIHPTPEPRADPTQACSGMGCRPTRTWIFSALQRLFEFVYLPKTQPNHDEFPLDWTAPEKHPGSLQRAIFIASRQALENPNLLSVLPAVQIRHE